MISSQQKLHDRHVDTKIFFYFEGNGGNKSISAREGTVVEVPRGGHRDDHHQSRKVRGQIIKIIYDCCASDWWRGLPAPLWISSGPFMS